MRGAEIESHDPDIEVKIANAMAEQDRISAVCTCSWDSRDGGGAYHYLSPSCPEHAPRPRIAAIIEQIHEIQHRVADVTVSFHLNEISREEAKTRWKALFNERGDLEDQILQIAEEQ